MEGLGVYIVRTKKENFVSSSKEQLPMCIVNTLEACVHGSLFRGAKILSLLNNNLKYI